LLLGHNFELTTLLACVRQAFSEAKKKFSKNRFPPDEEDIEAISMEKKMQKEGSGLPDLGYKDWLNGVFWA